MTLIRLQDADPEMAYELFGTFPKDENGYTNPTYGFSYKKFLEYIEMKRMWTLGEGLPEGFVPDTTYILEDKGKYVGSFNYRHCLNDFLREGPGHVGYGIRKEYRGKGYASKGLAMLIYIIKKQGIDTSEIYLEVNKDNPASLKVQKNNGAYIHHEGDTAYYTRIPLK